MRTDHHVLVPAAPPKPSSGSMTRGAGPENPSPAETCSGRVPERYCAAARRGGKQREGNCPAQKRMPMQVNSIRLLSQANPRTKGEAGSQGLSTACTEHVRARPGDGTGVGGLLSRGQRQPLREPGQLDSDAVVQPPTSTRPAQRPGSRTGPQSLSQCLLGGTRVYLPQSLSRVNSVERATDGTDDTDGRSCECVLGFRWPITIW